MTMEPDLLARDALAALIVLGGLTACSNDGEKPLASSASPSRNQPMQVAIVNYELVANTSNRFLVGLILPDNRLVAYGTVQMRFQALDAAGQLVGQASEAVTGSYLPVPGTQTGALAADPQAISAATVRGVYELEGVRFGSAGPWVVEVAARVTGQGVVQGSARFDVLDSPAVPGIGEPAPATDNPVLADPGVAPAEIDSRARGGTEVPDPRLHRVSIADAIADGKPAVVVFSTPVYCVSRFCGPVTDLVEELERATADRAAFIHVEIWKDFEAEQTTEAAAEWLLRSGSVNEPWLFMIGADGKIAARWDNLFTRPELEDGLESLLGRS